MRSKFSHGGDKGLQVSHRGQAAQFGLPAGQALGPHVWGGALRWYQEQGGKGKGEADAQAYPSGLARVAWPGDTELAAVGYEE